MADSWKEETLQQLLGAISGKFEEIGRFVQEFELMVAEARGACTDILARGSEDQTLFKIVLHHKALTAYPIMEIFRALYGQIVNDLKEEIDEKERAAISAILAQINKDYSELAEVRNVLLHGTWTIGYEDTLDRRVSGTLPVQKYKATSRGLELALVPKNVQELKAITQKCEETGRDIATLHHNFLYMPTRVDHAFKLVNGRWVPFFRPEADSDDEDEPDA